MQLPAAFTGKRWLEVALDYRCNLRCVGCHACHDHGERLSGSDALSLLRSGRERGVERLWLGGGEPTLREDLPSLVAAAKKLGYRAIALQTNGLRLGYPRYRDAIVAAGVTEVRLNVKSHRAEVHDRLSGGGDAHRLAIEALDGLVAMGVPVVADVLLARSTAQDLPATIAFLAARGVRRFTLWVLSAADSQGPEVLAEVPRLVDLGRPIALARREAQRSGATLESLHTPPCTLPPEARDVFAPAATLGLVVVGPDARPFALEASAFEGGAYVAACGRCVARPGCGGPRADYLRLHGDAEFVALDAPAPGAA